MLEEPTADLRKLSTDSAEISWDEFVGRWNTAVDNQCSDFGCVLNPGKSSL